MKNLGSWRRLVMPLVYFNVAWNLLLFGLNPAWGSIVLAWVWLIAGFAVVIRRRRRRAVEQRHVFLMRPQPRLPDPFRQPGRAFVLQPGERVIHIPQVGGSRKPQVPPRACSHWPRDEVQLSDGTTVAYICRRCDHDWANEEWVTVP